MPFRNMSRCITVAELDTEMGSGGHLQRALDAEYLTLLELQFFAFRIIEVIEVRLAIILFVSVLNL
jgi:hypothetical protein